MLSCFYIKIKNKKFAKGLDHTVLATDSWGLTPVLGVYRIATYARFFMLKKPIFILVPDFHGSTSRSGPVLRTMLSIVSIWSLTFLMMCEFNYCHYPLNRKGECVKRNNKKNILHAT